MTAETATPAAEKDNLLGVCHAIGEDFGINPLWLRLAFGVSILWNLWAVVAIYLALGIAVAASRLLFPNHKRTVAAAAPVAAAEQDVEAVEYAKAA